MQTVNVCAAGGAYEIEIETGLLRSLARATGSYRRVLLVTDERVGGLFGEEALASIAGGGAQATLLTLRSGGYARTLEALREVATRMTGMELGAEDALVGLGGGSLLDMCGYAAWNHRSIVHLLQIPTTLLAMADWAAGGKSAMTGRAGGRMLGCFFPPTRVLVDPSACYTLSDRAFLNGMAEILKVGCALDASLFHMLESLTSRAAVEARAEEIVWCALARKSAVLGRREEGHLLFGHQLAHAVEVGQRYRGLWHGEAVAVGMLCTTRYSQRCGYTARGTAERLAHCFKEWGLPTETDADDAATQSALRALGRVVEAPIIERVGWSTLRRLDSTFFENAWRG